MNKISVMTCDKLKNKCTGTNCFEAFQNREDAFEIYKDKDVIIGAFFSCNGCDEKLDESMAYMFDQLRRKKIETIHMAYCIEVECNRYDEIYSVLENEGFNVVKGTHVSVYK